jgi:hypothetical protein
MPFSVSSSIRSSCGPVANICLARDGAAAKSPILLDRFFRHPAWRT